jgi:hypothetical protein
MTKNKDDEIDDQVSADWEFTRRAEQLMSKLRTKGKSESSAADPDHQQEVTDPDQQNKDTPPKPK